MFDDGLKGKPLVRDALQLRGIGLSVPCGSWVMRKKCLVAAAVCFMGFLASPIAARAASPLDDLLVTAGSSVEGRTLEEWTARWWQWQFALQTNVSPIFDTNGVNAHVGQSGSVFFIGGGVTTGGDTFVLARRVTITSDLYLFFPVINWSGENVGRAVPLSAQELRDEDVSFVSSVTGVFANLDGEDVPPERILRILAPVFSYEVPDEKNLFQFFGLDLSGGTITPAVSDGFWVMLKPLPVGEHLLQFKGYSADNQAIAYIVEYTLTVRDPTSAEKVEALMGRIREERLPAKLTKSLGSPLESSLRQFNRGQSSSGIRSLTTFQRVLRRVLTPIDPDLAAELTGRAQEIMDLAGKGGTP